jgi:hypothetical protein
VNANKFEANSTKKTRTQCKAKWNSFGRKYMKEKGGQNTIGGTKSKWPLFHRIDDIIESSPKVTRLFHAVDIGKTSTPHPKSIILGSAKSSINLNDLPPSNDNDNEDDSNDEEDEDVDEGK